MNTKFAAAVAGLTMAVTMFSAGSAFANTPAQGRHQQVAAIVPLAMQYFCAQYRSECASGGRSQVAMTPNLVAVLNQINQRVNRTIRPVADTSDTWSLNPTSGDCEDFALSKRSALIHQGVPSGSLRIAYTHTRRGEPHAVLVVKTSRGDYVLDNLNNTVKSLSASGYRINSMSSSNPNRWIAG